ncbi:MAG: DNA topoisomerase, partial [Alphaproteobacteria bacterium]
MYIGGVDARGYHHLLWEIVDNAVDEAINGHAKRIDVVIDADRGGAAVTDDGRGIPIDMHPKHKRPALELILCTLHAGGKFGEGSYKVSGGLHGVGSSVVNALSESLTATVRRDGYEHTQSYRRGEPTGKLKRGGVARGHGTTMHFRPD